MILKSYMDEVLDECAKRIPGQFMYVDRSLLLEYPELHSLPLKYETVMERACSIRRAGHADSRAQALEWAYDSLIAATGYVRVGEVHSYEADKDRKVFAALVRVTR